MRYDLTDFGWTSSSHCWRRTGAAWSLRTTDVFSPTFSGTCALAHRGAIFPNHMGFRPRPTNRSDLWRKSGIWDGLMDAVVKAHDGKVQMIDSSIVRVHQHASGPKKEWRSLCGPKPRRLRSIKSALSPHQSTEALVWLSNHEYCEPP
jgi:transposase